MLAAASCVSAYDESSPFGKAREVLELNCVECHTPEEAKGGLIMATPLLAVLVLIETTDIVFAVDSIPAIFAVTDEVFLVFTANAFAILGLRAMYFLLADLVHRFVYLKVGLALILIWVGVKMMLKIDVFYIPTAI